MGPVLRRGQLLRRLHRLSRPPVTANYQCLLSLSIAMAYCRRLLLSPMAIICCMSLHVFTCLVHVITCHHTSWRVSKYHCMSLLITACHYMQLHVIAWHYMPFRVTMSLHVFTCQYMLLHVHTCLHMPLHDITCLYMLMQTSTTHCTSSYGLLNLFRRPSGAPLRGFTVATGHWGHWPQWLVATVATMSSGHRGATQRSPTGAAE